MKDLNPRDYFAVRGMTRDKWNIFTLIQLKADADEDGSCLVMDPAYPDVILCTEEPNPEAKPWAVFTGTEIWIQRTVYEYARDTFQERTEIKF